MAEARQKGWALITGASEGIGRALAGTFAANGHDLVLTARRLPELRSLARELHGAHGTKTEVLPVDLAEAVSPEVLYQAVNERQLTIDILVNNAGFGLYGPFLEREAEAQQELIQVNVSALTQLTHLFARDMARRGHGRILNVASTVAFLPGPYMATYFASKAYVLGFSEALRDELAGSGVSVTCLCPGLTESGFHERAGLTKSRMMRLAMASAESVAEAGYQGCMAGRAVVLPSFRNKLVPVLAWLLPNALLRSGARRMMQRRHL